MSRFKSKSNSSKSFEMSDKSYPLSKNRFISVSEFRNQIRVDIREYYFDESGDRKPGKKGINLSMDEWNNLKKAVPKVEKAIKGIDDSDNDSDDDRPQRKKSKKSDSDSNSDSEDQKIVKKSKKKKSDSEEESDNKHKKSKKSKEVLSDSDSD